MYYFKKLNEDGTVDYLISYSLKPNLTDPSFVEITENEYNKIKEELSDEPEPTDEDEISGAEFLKMIEGVM